jgi:transketolase
MKDYSELEKFASLTRKNCLYCIADLGVGHVGGSMSIVEILTALFNGEMRNLDPQDSKREDRDLLVISKGHSGPALYSVLAQKGYFPLSWLKTLNRGGTSLPSHCDRNRTPGIDMSTGSLGQGISVACGMAYGAKLRDADQRVYCIIGDGETEEGQNWEAAMFAASRNLDNLIVITDYNKLQLDGPVDEVGGITDLEDKWKAFGWEVARCDGHDLRDLDRAFGLCHEANGKPKMIICDTVKAKGFPRLENKAESHNAKITLQEVQELYHGEDPQWLN